MLQRKYQATLALSAAFFLFVCVCNWSALTDYPAPTTQLARSRSLPKLTTYRTSFKYREPAEGGPLRCAFNLHDRFAPPKQDAVRKKRPPVPPGGKASLEDDLEIPKTDPPEGVPTEGAAKGREYADEQGNGHTAERPVSEDSLPPFELRGVIRAGALGGDLVIVQDKASGEVSCRRQGESYRGVCFHAVDVGAIELTVPETGRRVRYVMTNGKWRPL
jgi:hypothetical protein